MSVPETGAHTNGASAQAEPGGTETQLSSRAYAAFLQGCTAEQIWALMTLDERLGRIMETPDPEAWLRPDALREVALIWHDPTQKARIKERYRKWKGDTRNLEDAVAPYIAALALAQEETASSILATAVVSFEELLTLKIPPRHAYLPWLSEQSLVMLYGPRGIGKTMALLSLALSLATARPFLRWQVPEPVGVLYVDGEMPLDELRSRAIMLTGSDLPPQMAFLSSELVYRRSGITLTLTPEHCRREIETIFAQRPALRVLVLDNVSCLFPGISEDKKQDWEPINAWLISLRHRGLTVILGHHAGKSGQQRGTSGREDALDTVIALSYPPNYRQEEGCHFLWSFQKSRGVRGETVAGLDVRLEQTANGLEWTQASLEQTRTAQAESMLLDGIPVKAIAEELSVNLSYVYRLKRSLGL